MKKPFVPYPLALLAKEKGVKFDRNFETYALKAKDAKRLNDSEMYAPLYQQLVDWLESQHRFRFATLVHWDGSVAYQLLRVWENKKGRDYIFTSDYFDDKYKALVPTLTEAFKLIP